METHVSQSIIMRIKEFGESDLLVTFFTHDRGRLKGVAKGGKRSQKRFANCLDLLCLAKLEYEVKKKGDLYLLNSCKLIHAFPGLRSDFTSLSLASYIVELTEVLFPLNVADKAMFELVQHCFFALNEGTRTDLLRIVFEAKAMALGGYRINMDRCYGCGRSYAGAGSAVFKRRVGCISCLLCEKESKSSPIMSPEAVKALQVMQSASWQEPENVVLSEDGIKEISQVLKLHIEYRIGKRLRSAKYLDGY